MFKYLLLFILLLYGNAYANTEISTSGTDLGIGTTDTANSLGIQNGLAIGNHSYTNVTAPSGGAIIQGNVGIGSTAPGQVLDVQGTIRTVGFNLSTSPTNGYYLKTDANGNGSWAAVSGSGTVNSGTANQASYYASSTNAVSGTSDLIFNGSNVGIGSATPGQILDVQGTIRSSYFSGNGSQLTNMPNTITDGTHSVTTTTTTTFGNGFVVGGSAGSATVNLNSPDNSQNSNYQIAAADMGGQVNFNGSNLTVTIPAISSTVLASGMTVTITNTNATPLTISSTPTINGYSGTKIPQYGGINCVSNGTSLDCVGLGALQNYVSNVGIGSATPGQSLDVQGTIRTVGFNLSTSPTNGYYLKTDANGNGSWAAVSGSGTVNSGTANQAAYYATSSTAVSSTADLIFNGSNVGINSATPGQQLDVQGTIRTLSIYSTIRTVSGTTDTLTNTDCGRGVEYTNSSAITVTVPNSLPIGCQVALAQYGTGKVSTSAASGATQNSPHSYTGTSAEYTEVYIHVITNSGGTSAVYSLLGDGS